METKKIGTVVVAIGPQNDVPSESVVNWGTVGSSVAENKTVENTERRGHEGRGYEVFISPITSIRLTMDGDQGSTKVGIPAGAGIYLRRADRADRGRRL